MHLTRDEHDHKDKDDAFGLSIVHACKSLEVNKSPCSFRAVPMTYTLACMHAHDVCCYYVYFMRTCQNVCCDSEARPMAHGIRSNLSLILYFSIEHDKSLDIDLTDLTLLTRFESANTEKANWFYAWPRPSVFWKTSEIDLL